MLHLRFENKAVCKMKTKSLARSSVSKYHSINIDFVSFKNKKTLWSKEIKGGKNIMLLLGSRK